MTRPEPVAGRRRRRTVAVALSGLLAAGAAAAGVTSGPVAATEPTAPGPYYVRKGTFYPELNPGSVGAEIVDTSPDGSTLVYTDAEAELLGFVDISLPVTPAAAGTVALSGEPTSVAITGSFALVAVNTSADFVNPSGELAVVDLATKSVVRTIPLAGQPDSIAIDEKNERYATIAIENERDEDLGGGAIPQLPAGLVQIVDLVGAPADWTVRSVDVTGLATVAPSDPEPEFVAINPAGTTAAVTLQENNHIALIDLASGTVTGHFPAGSPTVTGVDVVRSTPGLIEPTGAITEPREPDGITWITNGTLATADEGDYEGGSRGFTVFDTSGAVLHEAANTVELAAIRNGHYPERRSNSKGTEPEAVLFDRIGIRNHLFVASERGGFVAVYRADGDGSSPQLLQLLATGLRPEGLTTVPARKLLITANEGDPGDGLRSSITIFRLESNKLLYPQVTSDDATPGVPIAWGALSGLAADRVETERLYSVADSFYARSSFFELDTSVRPARIRSRTELSLAGSPVSYDLEGISTRDDGGFWMVSEGAGDAPSATSPNRLLRVAADGAIDAEVLLPAAVADDQIRFGFEGVASMGSGVDERVYVVFQREWASDPAGLARIGVYTPATDSWAFVHYPLDAVESPAGGWVGLSEITPLGGKRFLIVERDNQSGPDARVKRVYRISLDGVTPVAEGGAIPVVSKTLAHDLLDDLELRGGYVLEKVEGLAVARDGDIWAVTDNDGVNDSNGETAFWRTGTTRTNPFPAD